MARRQAVVIRRRVDTASSTSIKVRSSTRRARWRRDSTSASVGKSLQPTDRDCPNGNRTRPTVGGTASPWSTNLWRRSAASVARCAGVALAPSREPTAEISIDPPRRRSSSGTRTRSHRALTRAPAGIARMLARSASKSSPSADTSTKTRDRGATWLRYQPRSCPPLRRT